MLNFANRTLECTSLNSQPQRLDQMAAGHFMLRLLPLRWPRLDGGSWRKCGLDNIIELKLKAVDWLKRRISEGLSGHPNSSDAVVEHEHVLTESGMYASETLMSLHEANLTECEGWAQEMSASQKQQFPRQHPLRRPGARAGNGSSASSLASCACGPGSGRCLSHCDFGACGSKDPDGRMSASLCSVPMEKVHHAFIWKASMVRASLLLCLVARSYLRYLPYPYPPVSTVQSWIQ